MAWWVNGVQLKLGLLGKVIGFSVLALQIGQIQSFDAAQSQELLKSLTAGLGIALLTTMVGLVVAVTHATDRLCWPGTARPQPPGPSSTNSYHETLPARSLNLYRCRTKIA